MNKKSYLLTVLSVTIFLSLLMSAALIYYNYKLNKVEANSQVIKQNLIDLKKVIDSTYFGTAMVPGSVCSNAKKKQNTLCVQGEYISNSEGSFNYPSLVAASRIDKISNTPSFPPLNKIKFEKAESKDTGPVKTNKPNEQHRLHFTLKCSLYNSLKGCKEDNFIMFRVKGDSLCSHYLSSINVTDLYFSLLECIHPSINFKSSEDMSKTISIDSPQIEYVRYIGEDSSIDIHYYSNISEAKYNTIFSEQSNTDSIRGDFTYSSSYDVSKRHAVITYDNNIHRIVGVLKDGYLLYKDRFITYYSDSAHIRNVHNYIHHLTDSDRIQSISKYIQHPTDSTIHPNIYDSINIFSSDRFLKQHAFSYKTSYDDYDDMYLPSEHVNINNIKKNKHSLFASTNSTHVEIKMLVPQKKMYLKYGDRFKKTLKMDTYSDTLVGNQLYLRCKVNRD